jgi:uncharacterized protein YbjT (DUF2867 family)
MKALIFGATGLTGEALCQQLLIDADCTVVVSFVRKATGLQHPKYREIIANYDRLADHTAEIAGDVVFNCLGTTLAKVGSQAAQQVIDRDYPIAIAHLAAANKVPLMVSVSSVGTTPDTSNFYLKTKAEMEAGVVAAIGVQNTFFMRPSFLVGNRKELRIGERIGLFAMYGVDLVLLGGLRKYHSIQVADLAKAMIQIAKGNRPATQTPEYDEMMRLIKK